MDSKFVQNSFNFNCEGKIRQSLRKNTVPGSNHDSVCSGHDSLAQVVTSCQLLIPLLSLFCQSLALQRGDTWTPHQPK